MDAAEVLGDARRRGLPLKAPMLNAVTAPGEVTVGHRSSERFEDCIDYGRTSTLRHSENRFHT